MDMNLGFILYYVQGIFEPEREALTMKEISNQEFRNFNSSSSSIRGIIPRTG